MEISINTPALLFPAISLIMLAYVTMFLIYSGHMELAKFSFAISLILFTASLIVSLLEIQLSTKALELELSDIEGLEETGLVDYIKKKFD